jgi:hypothetical protein
VFALNLTINSLRIGLDITLAGFAVIDCSDDGSLKPYSQSTNTLCDSIHCGFAVARTFLGLLSHFIICKYVSDVDCNSSDDHP